MTCHYGFSGRKTPRQILDFKELQADDRSSLNLKANLGL